tara:strand:+ start:306 stop:749 length:444 start_codon:yes stop_codon:yes gene_type:complete
MKKVNMKMKKVNMKIKDNIQFLVALLFVINILNAGCGSCPGDMPSKTTTKKEPVNVNTLVTSVPKDGNVEGLMIASCGMCNFGKKDKSCELYAKIGEKLYSVEGTNLDAHGDAHSSDGFCNAVRIARAKGKVKKNTFHSDFFVLIGN